MQLKNNIISFSILLSITIFYSGCFKSPELKKAEKGYKDYQYIMAERYFYGNDEEIDHKKAIHWYTKAANNNQSKSQFKLAQIYFNGKIVERDLEKAIYWYTKAANNKHIESQYSLGKIYLDGKMLKKDLEKALYWFNKIQTQEENKLFSEKIQDMGSEIMKSQINALVESAEGLDGIKKISTWYKENIKFFSKVPQNLWNSLVNKLKSKREDLFGPIFKAEKDKLVEASLDVNSSDKMDLWYKNFIGKYYPYQEIIYSQDYSEMIYEYRSLKEEQRILKDKHIVSLEAKEANKLINSKITLKEKLKGLAKLYKQYSEKYKYKLTYTNNKIYKDYELELLNMRKDIFLSMESKIMTSIKATNKLSDLKDYLSGILIKEDFNFDVVKRVSRAQFFKVNDLISKYDSSLSRLNTKGLNYELELLNIYNGDFDNVRMKNRPFELSTLFRNYLEDYSRNCQAYLPKNKVPITEKRCSEKTTNSRRNLYGIEISSYSYCSKYIDYPMGLFADPVLNALSHNFGARTIYKEESYFAEYKKDAVKFLKGKFTIGDNLRGSYVNIENRVNSELIINDTEKLFRINQCTSPALKRFEKNLTNLIENKEPLLQLRKDILSTINSIYEANIFNIDFYRLGKDILLERKVLKPFNIDIIVADKNYESIEFSVSNRPYGLKILFSNGVPRYLRLYDLRHNTGYMDEGGILNLDHVPKYIVDRYKEGYYFIENAKNKGEQNSFKPSIINFKGLVYKTVVSPYSGRIWLDRNLGASKVCQSINDSKCYGDYFQWGRNGDGHEKKNSPITSSLSNNDVPNHSKFIKAQGRTNDWRKGQNDNLWQGVNGKNNPCPSGFRIPTRHELNNEIIRQDLKNNKQIYDSFLKLPSAGYRSSNNEGTWGYLWSSSTNGIYSRFLSFDSDNVDWVVRGTRANALSVRCIKD